MYFQQAVASIIAKHIFLIIDFFIFILINYIDLLYDYLISTLYTSPFAHLASKVSADLTVNLYAQGEFMLFIWGFFL